MPSASFSLEQEAYEFLVQQGGENRSGYINALLKKEKKSLLQEQIMRANREEAEDADYQRVLAEWDVTSRDGLE